MAAVATIDDAVGKSCGVLSRITFRFSGGALTSVPWHFIHHRPLQPVVMRYHAGSFAFESCGHL
jgi:hypothetical protein